jgi:hypothetical protein
VNKTSQNSQVSFIFTKVNKYRNQSNVIFGGTNEQEDE